MNWNQSRSSIFSFALLFVLLSSVFMVISFANLSKRCKPAAQSCECLFNPVGRAHDFPFRATQPVALMQSINRFLYGPTPEEKVRAWQTKLRSESRQLDREMRQVGILRIGHASVH